MKLTIITSLAGLGSLATAIPSELFERGDYGKCISKWEAKQWINSNIAMWDRKGDWKKLAKTLYADDFKAKSNSIKSSRGVKLSDDPYYNSLSNFVSELDKKIPNIYDQSTVGYYLDCNTLIWIRNIGRVDGCDDPVRDISVLTMQRKGKKIQAKDGLIEFDSITWGKALGGKYDPPKQQYNYGQNKGDGYGGKKEDDKKSSPNQNKGNDDEWDPKKNDGHQTDPHKNDDKVNQYDPKKNNGNGYDGKQSDPSKSNGYDDKKNSGTQVDPHKNDGNGYDGKQSDPKTTNGYDDKSGGTNVDPHNNSHDNGDKKDDGKYADPKTKNDYGKKDDSKKTDPQINNNGYGSDDTKDDGKHVDPQINNNGYGDDNKNSGTKVDPHQQIGYKNDGKQSDPKNNDKDGHNDYKKDY